MIEKIRLRFRRWQTGCLQAICNCPGSARTEKSRWLRQISEIPASSMVGPIVAELRRWPVPVSLDDVFVERYPQLVTQALQLTAGDRVAAEDLVHDTFVRLALRSLDPARVQNLDGYLFITMRNVHLSQVRRRVLQAPVNVSAVDYESIADRLLAACR